MEILGHFGRRRVGDDYFIGFAHYFRKQHKSHLIGSSVVDGSKYLFEHIERKTL